MDPLSSCSTFHSVFFYIASFYFSTNRSPNVRRQSPISQIEEHIQVFRVRRVQVDLVFEGLLCQNNLFFLFFKTRTWRRRRWDQRGEAASVLLPWCSSVFLFVTCDHFSSSRVASCDRRPFWNRTPAWIWQSANIRLHSVVKQPSAFKNHQTAASQNSWYGTQKSSF